MEEEHEFHSYVNLPPTRKSMTPARSMGHLAIPDHYRSISYEDTSTPSSSSIEPAVRTRSESTQMINDNAESLHSPGSTFVVAYEYCATTEDELDLSVGSVVTLITTVTHEEGWYRGEIDGKTGLFPSNYVRKIGDNNLLEVSAYDIKLPNENKQLDDFRIGYGATATVFSVDIKLYSTDAQGNKQFKLTKAALKRFHYHSNQHRGDTVISPYEMLKREANLVNGLQHPNIVRLLGICLEDPYFGLVLELCEGSSLRTVLNRLHTEKTIRVLINWGKQIASGMEYLCKQGYVHRDLKSDNVLVKQDVCVCVDEDSMRFDLCIKCGKTPLNRLQLKITDFGGTRKTADTNRFSSAGTYAWLAPEAFRDNMYSEASDVWSFGVVMWELLSGEEPFKGMFPNAIAFQVVEQGQSLEINQNCPEKWKQMMQDCWKIEAVDRPHFGRLVEMFEEYERETEDMAVSGVLDNQVKRVQSIVAQDVNNIYTKCGPNQLENLIRQYYIPVGGIVRKDRGSIAPETKKRKMKNHQKGKKLQISGPVGDMKHVFSVQKGENNEINFKLIYKDKDKEGGTLPRSHGSGKQYSFSASSPDLVQLFELQSGSSTVGHSASRISRQKAIRKKNPRSHASGDSPVSVAPMVNGFDNSINFAKIESAENDVAAAKELKKDGTLSKVFSKLHWKHHKRDSREEDDRAAGSVSSRSSSTTSRHVPPGYSGPPTRGAAATSFLDTSSTARSRASSAVDCYEDVRFVSPRHKVSPADKSRPVKQTNLTERFVKEDLARPAHLAHHARPRKSVLDQSIPASPTSPEQSYHAPMSVSASRRTTATSSTDGPMEYEFLPSQNNSDTTNHHYVRNHVMPPSLSSYVPVGANEPTHYDMREGMIANGAGHGTTANCYPVGGGCDDYIPVAGSQMANVAEISNSPYYDLSRPFNGRNVQNPQYYQCKPTKPPPQSRSTPIIIYPHSSTSGYHGMGHGSLYSMNEPPDHPAPPPPMLEMSPPTRLAPVIPPRDGSVQLHSFT